jgi:hypothetical protein
MTKTEFHPKAYFHLFLLGTVTIGLIIVWNVVTSGPSGSDFLEFWWMFGVCFGVLVLGFISNILSHWLTLSIHENALFINHKITGSKKILFSEIASAEIVESRGGRGYIYHSIELTLKNGKKQKLDGLYNQGIDEFCEEINFRLG